MDTPDPAPEEPDVDDPASAAATAANPAPTDPAADAPTFEDLAADPEIAALLDFDPVHRQVKRANGWSDPQQRMFIAWLAFFGSPGLACDALGKARSGVDKLLRSPGSDSFRAAWEGALDIAERRLADRVAGGDVSVIRQGNPRLDHRRSICRRAGSDAAGHNPGAASPAPAEGMARNEHGEWEDHAALDRRGEHARDSISAKLLRARRLYLGEISADPARRAAFEILTRLPVDWARAERLEPQDDEPWREPNMREADMLLTAENGWLGGEMVHGPDKHAELVARMNEWRAEEGLAPIDESTESQSTERSAAGA